MHVFYYNSRWFCFCSFVVVARPFCIVINIEIATTVASGSVCRRRNVTFDSICPLCFGTRKTKNNSLAHQSSTILCAVLIQVTNERMNKRRRKRRRRRRKQKLHSFFVLLYSIIKVKRKWNFRALCREKWNFLMIMKWVAMKPKKHTIWIRNKRNANCLAHDGSCTTFGKMMSIRFYF